MKTTLIALCALISIPLVAGELSGEPITAERIQLDLEMADGSRIIGTPERSHLEIVMATRIGTVSVPLSSWEKFEVSENGEKIVIQWAGGDRLTGRPERDSLMIHSLVGKISVPFSRIRSGQVTILEAADPLAPVGVKVSGSYGHAKPGVWGNHQVAYATDGKTGTTWSSGDWKGWIEVDLGEIHGLSTIRATLQFSPPGRATHCIYISNHPIGTTRDGARLLKRFSGHRSNNDVLAAPCPPGTRARYVQVHCPNSRSWFNLRELEIFGGEDGG